MNYKYSKILYIYSNSLQNIIYDASIVCPTFEMSIIESVEWTPPVEREAREISRELTSSDDIDIEWEKKGREWLGWKPWTEYYVSLMGPGGTGYDGTRVPKATKVEIDPKEIGKLLILAGMENPMSKFFLELTMYMFTYGLIPSHAAILVTHM